MSICQRCQKTNSSKATTACGHVFCTSCLVTFVMNHKSDLCPVCDVCMITNTDSHIAKSMSVKFNPSKSTSPSTSRLLQLNGSEKVTPKLATKKSRPVPRAPDNNASELEKMLYERKIVMANFNDGMITFIKLDGSDFLLSEYHQVVKDFKRDPRAYIQCNEFNFDNLNPVDGEQPLSTQTVLIPKFKWCKSKFNYGSPAVNEKKSSREKSSLAESDYIQNKKQEKISRKKSRLAESDYIRNKKQEKRAVMRDFNDSKITFIKLDGSDFLLSEYHQVVNDFKRDPKAYVQCEEFVDLGEDLSSIGGPSMNNIKTVCIPMYRKIMLPIASGLADRTSIDPTHVDIVD
jgi:hypothetical protein